MSAPVVLITGALTGIGRATALAFAREGAAVTFLASAKASFITGQIIRVNGGKTAGCFPAIETFTLKHREGLP